MAAAPFRPAVVEVTLSPRAASYLAVHGETIRLLASYSGAPRAGAEHQADESGQIDIGREESELSGQPHGPRRWTLAERLERRRVDLVTGPVMLNLNVFSGRRSSTDNVLSCDLFDGPLPDANRHPVRLHCSLITEREPTRALS